MSQPTLPSYTSYPSIPEDGVDEGEEEAGEEEVPTLADALAQLGLTDLTETFAKEMIDFDSFVSSVLKLQPVHSMCDSPVLKPTLGILICVQKAASPNFHKGWMGLTFIWWMNHACMKLARAPPLMEVWGYSFLNTPICNGNVQYSSMCTQDYLMLTCCVYNMPCTQMCRHGLIVTVR